MGVNRTSLLKQEEITIRKPEIETLQTIRRFSKSVINQVEKGRAAIRERAEKSSKGINDLTVKCHH